MTKKALSVIAQSCPHLTSLDVSFNRWVTSEAIGLLTAGCCPLLKKIDISGTSADDQAARTILSTFPNLQFFEFRNCVFSREIVLRVLRELALPALRDPSQDRQSIGVSLLKLTALPGPPFLSSPLSLTLETARDQVLTNSDVDEYVPIVCELLRREQVTPLPSFALRPLTLSLDWSDSAVFYRGIPLLLVRLSACVCAHHGPGRPRPCCLRGRLLLS